MEISPWPIIKDNLLTAGSYKKVRDITFSLPDGRQEIFTVNHVGCPVVAVLVITTDNLVVGLYEVEQEPQSA